MSHPYPSHRSPLVWLAEKVVDITGPVALAIVFLSVWGLLFSIATSLDRIADNLEAVSPEETPPEAT